MFTTTDGRPNTAGSRKRSISLSFSLSLVEYFSCYLFRYLPFTQHLGAPHPTPTPQEILPPVTFFLSVGSWRLFWRREGYKCNVVMSGDWTGFDVIRTRGTPPPQAGIYHLDWMYLFYFSSRLTWWLYAHCITRFCVSVFVLVVLVVYYDNVLYCTYISCWFNATAERPHFVIL